MISKRLKELRKANHLSQRQLAGKLGISRAMVGYLETGERNGTIGLLIKIAKFFDVSLDYLVGIER